MAAGNAYPYHLAFEEEASSRILLYPSAHQSSFNKHQTRRYHLSKEQTRSVVRPRQRHSPNWVSGGPGVQVIFLVPSPVSCGTGVFLPQRPGPDLHFQPNNTKPSPPAAAASASADMNRFRDVKVGGYQESGSSNNKKGKGGSNFSIQSRSKSNSPAIFLPKEWTY